ncbi:uncharacterized protein LOC123537501 isoform X2 [Mercenaria mercenaria]|uniref:uncharacterized protein LOC123537501 isoform X2 n=1 Tax=Mercenaria mercenaria TaxID=6596 RepID=UPI00234ECC25|nr:uncharacterized protein LOC123537501 isoform X2 [Mercenaria mercenaria]
MTCDIFIKVRYGFWYHLPQYDRAAFDEGYTRLNDVCKTDNYHGFLFSKDGNTKVMPIYDLNGNLAGIQSAIPGNMRGYNSLNETIDLPPVEIMPPVLKGLRDAKGILYYTVTAYFKHPKLICSPMAPKGVTPGRGLYIQMGFNPEHDFLHIPRENRHLSPLWRRGNCVPMMGTHYFMNLSQNLPCEKIYPLFLMYDMEGNLGAFGWVFQGRPNNLYSKGGTGWFHLIPETYPFLYKSSMLPPCMFYEKFQVFGIHIYLQDPKNLLCTISNVKQRKTTENPQHHNPARPPPTYITAIEEEKYKNINSENYAIEAFDSNSSSRSVNLNKHLFTLVLVSVSNFICLKYVIQR